MSTQSSFTVRNPVRALAAFAAGTLLLAGVASAGDHDRHRDRDRGYPSRDDGRDQGPWHGPGGYRSERYIPTPRGPVLAEVRRQSYAPRHDYRDGYAQARPGWRPPPPLYLAPPPVYGAPHYRVIEPRVVYRAPVYAPPVAYYQEPSYYSGPTYYSSYDNEPSYDPGYAPGYYDPRPTRPCRPKSGAGTVIGAVAGGVIGHNVAGGPARGVGTVLGAIAGGVVGNAVEDSSRCQ